MQVIMLFHNIFAVLWDELSLLGRLLDSWKENNIYIHVDETAINLQAGKIITYGKSYTFHKKQNLFPFLLVEVFGSY